MDKNKFKGGIYGGIIGDALGGPVQFFSRDKLKQNPVYTFISNEETGYKAGEWSDDTSLTLCLLDSLSSGRLDYYDIMKKFRSWLEEGKYTPSGKAFGMGRVTINSIRNFEAGQNPLECGGRQTFDNGNGALMRIFPIVLYIHQMTFEERVKHIENVTKITHAHKRSIIASTIYIEFILNLFKGMDKKEAFYKSYEQCEKHFGSEIDAIEFQNFQKLKNIENIEESKILTSAYVVETLEAVLWCVFNTNSYRDCVLKAVNLGGDTDTIGSISGTIAGVIYGYENVSFYWINKLVNINLIENIYNKCESVYFK